MITSFHGEYRFLSNFYPCKVIMGAFDFPTAEHAYQASKTLDMFERRRISELKTPGQAKRLGRRVSIRRDWEEVKLSIMEFVLIQKFTDLELYLLLVRTHPHELIEGNNWGDRFWGCELENGEWVGENNLGKLLMKIREME